MCFPNSYIAFSLFSFLWTVIEIACSVRKDMRIRFWNLKMEAGATFDMSAFGPCPVVQSVCLSSDGTKLLVGVRGCEVRLLRSEKKLRGRLSHFDGKLKGLASHSQRAEFVSRLTTARWIERRPSSLTCMR